MYLVMSTILMTALRIFWSRIQNNPETKNHNQEEPVPINFFFAILVILVMVEASTLQHIQRSSGDRDAEVK